MRRGWRKRCSAAFQLQTEPLARLLDAAAERALDVLIAALSQALIGPCVRLGVSPARRESPAPGRTVTVAVATATGRLAFRMVTLTL